jgi:hypothetical protein
MHPTDKFSQAWFAESAATSHRLKKLIARIACLPDDLPLG